jgi:hypothetical protein
VTDEDPQWQEYDRSWRRLMLAIALVLVAVLLAALLILLLFRGLDMTSGIHCGRVPSRTTGFAWLYGLLSPGKRPTLYRLRIGHCRPCMATSAMCVATQSGASPTGPARALLSGGKARSPGGRAAARQQGCPVQLHRPARLGSRSGGQGHQGELRYPSPRTFNKEGKCPSRHIPDSTA